MKKLVIFFTWALLLGSVCHWQCFGVDGALDVSFNPSGNFPGMPGIETIPLIANFGTGSSVGRITSSALQPDGKIIVAGQTSVPAAGGVSFSLARLLTDGSLDIGFESVGTFPGVPGIITIPLSNFVAGATDAGINACALQQDGKIVVVGRYSAPGITSAIAAVRFLTNGALDTTFNSGGATPGVLTIPLATFGAGTTIARAFSTVIQPDGKIVISGQANPTAAGGTLSMTVVRLLTNGTLDTSFNASGELSGNPGVATIPRSTFGAGTTLANALVVKLQSNNIVLAGLANPTAAGGQSMSAARLMSNGSLDTSFNNNGFFPGSPGTLTIVRTDFGTGTNNVRCDAMIIQNNGRIILAGQANPTAAGGLSFAAVRLTSDGAYDKTFNKFRTITETAGALVIPLSIAGAGATFSAAFAAEIQSDGKIILAGRSDPTAADGETMAIARLYPSGAIDTTFNSTGILPGNPGFESIPLIAGFGAGANFASANSLLIQPNGNIIVSGRANPTEADGESFAIVRLFNQPESALTLAIKAKYCSQNS